MNPPGGTEAMLARFHSRVRWLALYWMGMFALTHVPHIDRLAPALPRLIPHADKIVHGLLYGGWAASWHAVLTATPAGWRRGHLLALFVLTATYAAIDELTQPMVGRTAALGDWVVDLAAFAAVIGWCLWRSEAARSR